GAAMLGIEELLDRKPKQLSGGQRQRVAVGRTIVREPQVFLMDEPLSNLDAKLRVATRAEISKLHQRLETTFIYVTHDQMEAMTMGTRICVMRDGILQQVDSPGVLYNTPNNIFVAGFIGSPAMNFFDVTVTGSKEEMYLDGGSYRVRVPAHKAQPLYDYLGKEVVFGIRPEDVSDPNFAPPNITGAPVDIRVDVTELMGHEIFLYCLTGTKSFIARVDPRSTARVGQDIQVLFNMDNMHVFDRDTEIAIR
ncbi:MAG: ATP-binding cassette domain-containing protein, partial [Chloroflexi bacterium]|nr:ATP-binding cassette domain-containing protein [Chloroflexota bacterium]